MSLPSLPMVFYILGCCHCMLSSPLKFPCSSATTSTFLLFCRLALSFFSLWKTIESIFDKNIPIPTQLAPTQQQQRNHITIELMALTAGKYNPKSMRRAAKRRRALMSNGSGPTSSKDDHQEVQAVHVNDPMQDVEEVPPKPQRSAKIIRSDFSGKGEDALMVFST